MDGDGSHRAVFKCLTRENWVVALRPSESNAGSSRTTAGGLGSACRLLPASLACLVGGTRLGGEMAGRPPRILPQACLAGFCGDGRGPSGPVQGSGPSHAWDSPGTQAAWQRERAAGRRGSGREGGRAGLAKQAPRHTLQIKLTPNMEVILSSAAESRGL